MTPNNMPGFSAENAIASRQQLYQMTSRLQPVNDATVQPAALPTCPAIAAAAQAALRAGNDLLAHFLVGVWHGAGCSN